MNRLVVFLALLLPLPAFAQQGPPPSAEEQALAGKLGEEYNSNLQLRAKLIQAQQQIKTLSEENAKLKASVKAEGPKPPEPPKK
jgi:small-conductance mechanosensitive channel